MKTKLQDHTNITALLSASILCLLLAVAGCGDVVDDDGQGHSVGTTVQSQCKATPAGPTFAGPSLGTVTASASGSTATILHQDAYYNCASKLKLLATVKGQQITVKEQIVNPTELARCMCNYDLSVPVMGLADGDYTVQVFNADGKLAGSAALKVGGASQTSTIQSACKPPPPGPTLAGPGLGTVTATANSGAVTVLHQDAFYNCASKVAMQATLKGQQILVHEVITNPGEAAFCTCRFDLSTTLNAVPAGSYTVKVFDADGKPVGSASVTIP